MRSLSPREKQNGIESTGRAVSVMLWCDELEAWTHSLNQVDLIGVKPR